MHLRAALVDPLHLQDDRLVVPHFRALSMVSARIAARAAAGRRSSAKSSSGRGVR
jgi:hypothetical protein